MNFRVALALGFAGAILLTGTASAQTPDQGRRDEDLCRDAGWDDDSYRTCEVREESMAAQPLTVDAGRNGGIRVEGWDRNEILVRAIVTANARNEADAKQLASAVQIQVAGGKVSAVGPTTERRQWWSV